ncbi:hypothetical protein [Clostridium botulinum]|uniref:hypothetical protein n=1 Tax=Clostridium botulinum TaxID=1491 RepID=UPI001967E4EF|nr:hypothetical protein [Clostridium botulinum]MBN1079342.1 hypothetical protein [Clostridium botulinum]
MAFSFSGLVSAVVGAVAAVANAIGSAVKSIVSAVSGNGSQAAGGIESAASGAMAIIADIFEDGEIDEGEEELLEEAFKLLVGAFIFPFDSGSSECNSAEEKSTIFNSVGAAVEKSWNSIKEIGHDFWSGMDNRGQKAFDSGYDFANWLGCGVPDVVKETLKSNAERSEKAFDSAYDLSNWISSGSVDMVKETFNPKDPLSKEHWLNSFGTASAIFGIKETKGSVPKKSGVGVKEGSKSIDNVYDATKGVSNPKYTRFRDLMSPEEVAIYDKHWTEVAERISNEALDNQRNFIKNGGITKPGGGAYKPAKISAAVDMNTGDISFGYNGANKFNPSTNALKPELQTLIDNTKSLAANDLTNPYAARNSYELWSVDNCAEVYATNNALINGANIDNIFLNTKFFNNGAYAEPCANCKITFKDFGMPNK